MDLSRFSRQQIILFSVIFVFMFALFVLIGTYITSTSIDDADIQDVNIDKTSQAYVVNGEILLGEIGNTEAYDRFTEDLHTFGISSYEKYRSGESELIGFEIIDLSSADETIKITGVYGATNNKIDAEIDVLNKNRIYSSITDTVENTNIDSRLPSNDPIEQFIGSLPIENQNYSIDYQEDDEITIIYVYNSASGYDEAIALIRSQIGENVSKLTIISDGIGSGTTNFGNL